MITEDTIKINRGVCAAARLAGVTKGYMSQLANGTRKGSKRTKRKLKKLGIVIPARDGGADAAGNTGN